MIILSIETSCDETAIAVLECKGGTENPTFKILGEALNSQIKIHEQYGGVFPMMAKREHAKNLVPLLLKTFKCKGTRFFAELRIKNYELRKDKSESLKVKAILKRETGLFEQFEKHLFNLKKPNIDLIAVTEGPGLEPALWVGISFAKALGVLWDIPVVGINHMEGHIFSVLINQKNEVNSYKLKVKSLIEFPALSLLISGGHTELVEIKDWHKYKILGKTRDDAVGEAFDKVARILGLPYPGGPQISALAEKARSTKSEILKKIKFENTENSKLKTPNWSLPRPMLRSNDLDFSFSGLKTAVLYLVQKIESRGYKIDDEERKEIAKEFEDAVTETLVHKTKKAIEKTKSKTLIVAGGVSANKNIKKNILKLKKEFSHLQILFPSKKLSTDNAVMIGMAAYLRSLKGKGKRLKTIKARGNLSL